MPKRSSSKQTTSMNRCPKRPAAHVKRRQHRFRPPTTPPAATARGLSLRLLNELDSQSVTLDTLLHSFEEQLNPLSPRDRRLFNALVFGVLRWRKRLDRVIAAFSRTALQKLDPEVRNVLRLGTMQITRMSRIPDSAAVNTSVELAKSFAPHWVVRFVNGVLRNVATGHTDLKLPDFNEDPIVALAVNQSFPRWLVKRWLARLSPDATAEMCAALNRIPPITLRTNTLKIERTKLQSMLAGAADQIEFTRYTPHGLALTSPHRPVPELPGFTEGYFQVQDEAAQLVSQLLDPRAGETVVDACAGLGGKTGHIATLMQNRGTILALDNQRSKLDRLAQEMERLGHTIVTPVCHDLHDPLAHEKWTPVDRVLLDAPCSGLGVLRRNPDAKWSSTPEHLLRNQERQILFLQRVTCLLKPQGVLVYAVCSTEPEETQAVVNAFLKKRPDFVPEAPTFQIPPQVTMKSGLAQAITIYPHLAPMDGFFMVRLRRVASVSTNPTSTDHRG